MLATYRVASKRAQVLPSSNYPQYSRDRSSTHRRIACAWRKDFVWIRTISAQAFITELRGVLINMPTHVRNIAAGNIWTDTWPGHSAKPDRFAGEIVGHRQC